MKDFNNQWEQEQNDQRFVIIGAMVALLALTYLLNLLIAIVFNVTGIEYGIVMKAIYFVLTLPYFIAPIVISLQLPQQAIRFIVIPVCALLLLNSITRLAGIFDLYQIGARPFEFLDF